MTTEFDTNNLGTILITLNVYAKLEDNEYKARELERAAKVVERTIEQLRNLYVETSDPKVKPKVFQILHPTI